MSVDEITALRNQVEQRDRELLDMRLQLIQEKILRIDDHETRIRGLEGRLTEVRTIVTLAFGTGILSLGNLLTQWLK